MRYFTSYLKKVIFLIIVIELRLALLVMLPPTLPIVESSRVQSGAELKAETWRQTRFAPGRDALAVFAY